MKLQFLLLKKDLTVNDTHLKYIIVINIIQNNKISPQKTIIKTL